MRKGKRTFASRKRKIAGLSAFVLAGVIGVGAYAFTASNTVPLARAGVGVGKVTGYKVEHEEYTFGGAGSTLGVEKVKLTLNESGAEEVKVAFTKEGTAPPATGAEWKECTITGAEAECEWATPFTNGEKEELYVEVNGTTASSINVP
jgi:hypothetical protein